jgi:hypothetical protein
LLVFLVGLDSGAVDRHMEMRVELAFGGHRFQAGPLEDLDDTVANQLQALQVLRVHGFGFERAVEIVHHRQQRLDRAHRRVLTGFFLLAL